MIEARFAELLAKVEQAQALFPADVHACTNFALDATDAGRADLSIRLLEPLSALAPRHAKLWQILGLAYRDEQMMAQANAAFFKAATLAPQDALIQLGQATVALESGLPSAHHYKALLKQMPGNVELVLSAASALDAEGQIDAADALLARTLEAQPGWVAGHELLASKRWAMGRTTDYTKSFARAMQAQPGNPALVFGWYRVMMRSSQWQQAQEVIAQARLRLGDLPEFAAVEARIRSELGGP